MVGLNKKLWTEIYSSRWDRMDEDLAVFDLVGQTALSKSALPSTRLPQVVTLTESVEKHVSKLKELQQSLQESKFQLSEDMYLQQWHTDHSKFTLKIKQLFLNFMIYLVNDFEDFFKPQSKYGQSRPASEAAASSTVASSQAEPSKPEVRTAEERKLQNATAHQVFDFDKYTSQANHQEFRSRFVLSQSFIHFIEEAYHTERGHVPQDQSIDSLRKYLRTARSAVQGLKTLRDIQDEKIDKLIYTYDSRRLTLSLREGLSRYQEAAGSAQAATQNPLASGGRSS